nr:hypothetical protein [Clostridium akagii]
MKKIKIMTMILALVVSTTLFAKTNIVKAEPATVGVSYSGHVQSIGWQKPVTDGQEAGTDGQGLRVEALKLSLTNAPAGASISYQTHVENIGWQKAVSDGAEAGTDGKALRVEALKISLVGMPGYSVQYRAHVQSIGWQAWVSDGQEAGTDGKSLRVEAIEIKIVKISDNTTVGVSYQGHVENVGWQSSVQNGQIAGTEGQALRVEALKLNLVNAPAGAAINYQGHVENVGWQTPTSNGLEVGTDGKSLRVEAMKITLSNMPGYSVQYRAHVENIGWQSWVADGQETGTDGKGLRIEAIEVRIVKTADGSTPTPVAFVPATTPAVPVNPTPDAIIAQDNVPTTTFSSNVKGYATQQLTINTALGKTKLPTGNLNYTNAGVIKSGDVYQALDIDANYVSFGQMTVQAMKNDILSAYTLNNNGVYSNNGVTYKLVNAYAEYVISDTIDDATVLKYGKELNKQFLTTGFDASQTFDRIYIDNTVDGKYIICRVVIYFNK